MVLQALDGEVVARGPNGQRTIAASELFVDAMTTSLAPDEIVTEVHLPTMPAGTGCAIEEFARRQGDFAIAAVAVTIARDGDRCVKARIATAGVSSHSERLRAAEQVLEQDGLGEPAILQAADAAAEIVNPLSDQHASANYRRQLTRVLTERAVRRAAAA
jgi:carbon-monoxide dehydrogenase medium subunit